jgi:hypothetical protein
MSYAGLGQAPTTAANVVQFAPVSRVDIQHAVATNAAAQMDPRTPGGAAMQSWSASGFSTDATALANAVAAGLSQSKNDVVREAAAASVTMGTTMAAACTKSGVGAAAAPLCGAVGAISGAVAGALTAVHNKRHQAAVNLRAEWYGANVVLMSSIRAIQGAYANLDSGVLKDHEAVCLLVNAMRGRGSKLAYAIWGPFTTKAQAHSSPCGVPGVLCVNGWSNMATAQGHKPLPALEAGRIYPQYAIMEKWWMLKGGNDANYGNCVNANDLKPDAAFQGRVSTRRERARRLRQLNAEMLDATQVAIAAMINLKDQRSKQLAQAYGRSKQYEQDVKLAAGAAQSIQREYGAYMNRVTRLKNAGYSEAEAKGIAKHGEDATAQALAAKMRTGQSKAGAATLRTLAESSASTTRGMTYIILAAGVLTAGGITAMALRKKARGR